MSEPSRIEALRALLAAPTDIDDRCGHAYIYPEADRSKVAINTSPGGRLQRVLARVTARREAS